MGFSLSDLNNISSGSFTNTLSNGYNSITNSLGKLWDRYGGGQYRDADGKLQDGLLGRTYGSGDKARAGWQLGLEAFNALATIKAQENALDESRRQFDYQKDLSRANYLNSGANFLNQNTWQLENLAAFNPEAAAERANNLQPVVNQMNQTASTIGAGSDAFNQQAQTIAKYSTLKPTVNS